jgi:hypothetical protein
MVLIAQLFSTARPSPCQVAGQLGLHDLGQVKDGALQQKGSRVQVAEVKQELKRYILPVT